MLGNTAVDIINKVIPYFSDWSNYLVGVAASSTILNLILDIPSQFGPYEGLTLRLILWSIPSMILFIIAFKNDLKLFYKKIKKQ